MKHKITGKRTLHDRLREELHDPEFRSAYEEADLPVISAYDHPLVGLVLSTPDETVLVRS